MLFSFDCSICCCPKLKKYKRVAQRCLIEKLKSVTKSSINETPVKMGMMISFAYR